MHVWRVMIDGREEGPLPTEDLREMARSRRVGAANLVWREGMSSWLPMNQVPELTSVVAQVPAPPPGMGDDPGLRLLLPVGRSGWAIAAGYLGLFSLLLVPAPVALLCGVMALREIGRNPRKHGKGRAWFGVFMGAIGTAVLGLVFLGMIASR